MLSRFLPHQPATGARETVRAGAGACLGIALTGALSTAWAGLPGAAPMLIAPMGASAVLLFAVPASPLAQPYAMLGGNLLAALIGVTAARLISAPIPAAALAVSLAIMAMALCRCIHPPSGAVALTAVLGGPKLLALGYGFVVAPVLLNSLLLIAAALAWNNATGRSYPHRPHPVAHPPAAPKRAPLPLSAYAAVIADYGEALDIDAEDLRALHEALDGR